jgi:hypothetical protein
MSTRFTAHRLWVFTLVLLAHSAHADFFVRGFDPPIPNSAQPPSIVVDNLRGPNISTCEVTRADVPPRVTVEGNLMTIKMFMGRIDTVNPLCQIFPSSIGGRWQMGAPLPAGNYTVRFFGNAQEFEPTSNFPEFFLGELPLTVTTAASLPTLGGWSMALLTLLVLVFSIRKLNTQHSTL